MTSERISVSKASCVNERRIVTPLAEVYRLTIVTVSCLLVHWFMGAIVICLICDDLH